MFYNLWNNSESSYRSKNYWFVILASNVSIGKMLIFHNLWRKTCKTVKQKTFIQYDQIAPISFDAVTYRQIYSNLECVVKCLSFVYSTAGVPVQCDQILQLIVNEILRLNVLSVLLQIIDKWTISGTHAKMECWGLCTTRGCRSWITTERPLGHQLWGNLGYHTNGVVLL